ncbi:MAG: class I SAM-dependent methyltransferase [Bacteroidota bacterium]
MTENFNLYSKYYDLIYQDKNYLEETNYVSQTLKEFNPSTSEILELGCGSGNHAKFLSKEGFSLTGIDRSETMISEAKEKNIPNFTAHIGDITNFDLKKKFDSVISLFHVMSYLTKNEDLHACFQNTNKHLKNNGIFLFDCWFTPAVYHLKPESRVKQFENEEINVERRSKSIMDLSENTIDVHFDIQIEHKNSSEHSFLQENHLMRHFSLPEIEFFASQSGFKVLRCEELISRNEASFETWAVCFILQKTQEI